jgi:hypothetical protein
MKRKRIWKILIGVGLIGIGLLVVVGFMLVRVFDVASVTRSDSLSIELGDAETVRAEISMEMGHLEITGGADNLMSADLAYEAAEWKPVVEYRVMEDQGALAVRPPENADSLPFKAGYDWDVRLNNDVPIDLNVAFDAGKATLNLEDLSLSALELLTGASDVSVDLTANYQSDLSARIWGGIGRITILLPDDVGVIIDARGDSSVNTSGLIRGGNSYVNPAFGASDVTLSIDIVSGFGEINLEVDGAPAAAEARVATCDDVNTLATLADHNIPHAAEERLTLTENFYKEAAEGYGFGKLYGYGQGQVDFTKWEVRRGALDPETGSLWWRAVNGQLIRDMLEARYLYVAGLSTCAGSNEAVDTWLAYFAHPSSQSWYLAHNESIVLGYLTYEDLALQESFSEQTVMVNTLFRVTLADQMVTSDEALPSVASDSRGPAVGLITSVPLYYPADYTLTPEQEEKALYFYLVDGNTIAYADISREAVIAYLRSTGADIESLITDPPDLYEMVFPWFDPSTEVEAEEKSGNNE